MYFMSELKIASATSFNTSVADPHGAKEPPPPPLARITSQITEFVATEFTLRVVISLNFCSVPNSCVFLHFFQ